MTTSHTTPIARRASFLKDFAVCPRRHGTTDRSNRSIVSPNRCFLLFDRFDDFDFDFEVAPPPPLIAFLRKSAPKSAPPPPSDPPSAVCHVLTVPPTVDVVPLPAAVR